MRKFFDFLRDNSGATAIEYGLISALISVAALTALQGVGDELNTTFGSVSTSLKSANTPN